MDCVFNKSIKIFFQYGNIDQTPGFQHGEADQAEGI
jgi:hypothetical protein